jgi:dihydrolipoamide dehydrogenase
VTRVVVPDLGDFKDVEVIDVLVKPGDTVQLETPLITLETEKATMDVPSSAAGVVKSVVVKKGDRVSKGSAIIEVEAVSGSRLAVSAEKSETSAPAAAAPAAPPAAPAASESPPTANRQPQTASSYDFEVVVLGAGPGGYTAAFRAADLGMKTALIERWPQLGGVCLNVGCIPSKALLHAAKVIEEAEAMGSAGVQFGKPQIDATKLREWKNKVVGKLTGGLATLAKQRKVEVIRGTGKFVSPHEIEVAAEGAKRRVSFAHCIIAAGSESIRLPNLPDDPRIIDSTGALELDLPKRMLVVGGGIIGLEMATVYDALGVKVSVVELTDGLMPGCDRDLVRPLERRIARRYERIMVKTKVTKVEAAKEGLRVTFDGEPAQEPQVYDRVLIAVGRSPNGRNIGADAAGVLVNERGFVPVDRQMRTNVPHIFAIGDIAGQPMLAHKASHEGKLAAEVAHGEKRAFDARVIPSVAYTDPEVAWVGLTETDAKVKGTAYEKASFPWVASGRSLTLGRDDGMTKLLFDPATHRVIGGGIVGPNAGDLIAEVALAIEMGSDAADLGLTIHPHPTLSETIMFAAESFEGTLTDLYVPKKK